MQLKRGARTTLDYLESDLTELIENSHDPVAVEMLARRIRERIKEEIEPRLQRAAPALEERVAALEAWRESIEGQGKVTLFRKAE